MAKRKRTPAAVTKVGPICTSGGPSGPKFVPFYTQQWKILQAVVSTAPTEVPTFSKPSSDAAAALVYLTEEDSQILRALAAACPLLLTEKQIEKPEAADVQERTLARRLPRLEKKGLVCRPEGKRSGWGITALGLKTVPPDEIEP